MKLIAYTQGDGGRFFELKIVFLKTRIKKMQTFRIFSLIIALNTQWPPNFDWLVSRIYPILFLG